MAAIVSDGLYSVYAGLKSSITDSQSFVLKRGIPLIAGSAGALYLSNPAGWSEYLIGTAAAFGVAATIQILQDRKISLSDKLDEDLLKIVTVLASSTLAAAWHVDYLNVDLYTPLIKGSSILLGSGAIVASLCKIANEVNYAHRAIKRGHQVNYLNKAKAMIADKFSSKVSIFPDIGTYLNKIRQNPAKVAGIIIGVAATGLAATKWPETVIPLAALAYCAHRYRKIAGGAVVLFAAYQYPNAVLPFALPAAVAFMGKKMLS